MIIPSLVDFTLTDNDKKLLVVLLFVLILLFIVVGLLGWLIRFVSVRFEGRMDYEIHDAVVYRVIQSPEQLRKYGRKKNNRLYVKANLIPFFVAIASLLVWIIYSAIDHSWARNYFGEFSTLLFNFDWSNENCHTVVWGVRVLSRWPDLISSPHWVNAYWGSYLLVPLWLVAIVWYAINTQAYLARAIRLNKRCHTVFEKSLDDFNFFDDVKQGKNPFPSESSSAPINNNSIHPQ